MIGVAFSNLKVCMLITGEEISREHAIVRTLFRKTYFDYLGEKRNGSWCCYEGLSLWLQSLQLTDRLKITTNICARGHTYTQRYHVVHPVRAEFNRTQKSTEEDVSSAEPENNEKKLCNNTVLTRRRTDTSFVTGDDSTSVGSSFQS